MNVNIHYDPSTGEIKQIDNSEPHHETGEIMPSHDGVTVASIEMDGAKFGNGINPGNFKFDVGTQSLVPHISPLSRERINCFVYSELCSTDEFMSADRPLPDEKRAAWTSYRQALRDLSKLQDANAMLSAFPSRPDGLHALAHLNRAG
jgi:hypothetical protein